MKTKKEYCKDCVYSRPTAIYYTSTSPNHYNCCFLNRIVEIGCVKRDKCSYYIKKNLITSLIYTIETNIDKLLMIILILVTIIIGLL